MNYKIKFKTGYSCNSNSLNESVEIINSFILNNKICAFPITKNIVSNWTTRSKSRKYDWVEITKLVKN